MREISLTDGPSSVARAIAAGDERGSLARGAGRAYGDAALNRSGQLLALRGGRIELDPATGAAHLDADVTLGELLRAGVSAGWFPHALPGTRHVTVGGAVAADVHGKDHHLHGTFGSHLTGLTLVDGRGEIHELGPTADAEAFWATVGGMGLTGVVTSVDLQLAPVETGLLTVRTERYDDLDTILTAMAEPASERYCVAWLDALGGSPGRPSWPGRGVVEWADHASAGDLRPSRRFSARRCAPRLAVAIPPVPVRLVSGPLVRGFNEVKFRRSPIRATRLTGFAGFFHQLDALQDWNRLYGPRGLIQYHVIVPPPASGLLREIVERLRAARIPPLLAVLKRHGPANEAPLSFPREGWALALDLPAGHRRLAAVLKNCDAQLAAAGGRVYLAKDATLRPEVFAAMYPGLPDWQRVRERLDPQQRLRSDLGRRLGLCP